MPSAIKSLRKAGKQKRATLKIARLLAWPPLQIFILLQFFPKGRAADSQKSGTLDLIPAGNRQGL